MPPWTNWRPRRRNRGWVTDPVANFTAVYDACVLYPAPLRDLLIRAAGTDLFRARWTETIHQEWTRSVLANNSHLNVSQMQRTMDLMNRAVPDCLVTNYESLIESLDLPDPDDRHVLAAAIRCDADVIVTTNLKDFPAEILSRYEIEAQHPDVFLSHLFDLNPSVFCRAVRDQRLSLRNPPLDIEALLNNFHSLGLMETVIKLRSMIELI